MISKQVLKSVTHRQLKLLVLILLETIEWKLIQYKTFWTPESILTDVIRSHEYRDDHCLQYFKLEEIEDRIIQRYKASLIKNLINQGAEPGLKDHSDETRTT